MIVINADKLNDIIKIVDTVTSECIVTFDDEGMHLYLGDSANVMRCFIDIKKEWFVEYSPSNVEYGISLDNIKNVVARASKNSNIWFTADSYGKKISITFTDNDITYKGLFICINIAQMARITKFGEAFQNSIVTKYVSMEINIKRMIDVLNALAPFYTAKEDMAKNVLYKLTEDGMDIISGNEFTENTMECNIPVNILKLPSSEEGEYPFTATFGSMYVIIMKSILSICNSNDNFKFYIKTNSPLYFETNIHDNTCHIEYICACKISK